MYSNDANKKNACSERKKWKVTRLKGSWLKSVGGKWKALRERVLEGLEGSKVDPTFVAALEQRAHSLFTALVSQSWQHCCGSK